MTSAALVPISCRLQSDSDSPVPSALHIFASDLMKTKTDYFPCVVTLHSSEETQERLACLLPLCESLHCTSERLFSCFNILY